MDLECDEIIFYSNNEICLVEVQFSIPGELWSGFERSPAYQGLKDYLDSLQTQYMQKQLHEPVRIQEIEALSPHSKCSVPHESFWARAHRWFHKNGAE